MLKSLREKFLLKRKKKPRGALELLEESLLGR